MVTSSTELSEKSLQIKEDDKFFSRLLTKESSMANPSFRVYYGDATVAVPFLWESRPVDPRTDNFIPLMQPPTCKENRMEPSDPAMDFPSDLRRNEQSSLQLNPLRCVPPVEQQDELGRGGRHYALDREATQVKQAERRGLRRPLRVRVARKRHSSRLRMDFRSVGYSGWVECPLANLDASGRVECPLAKLDALWSSWMSSEQVGCALGVGCPLAELYALRLSCMPSG
ncbi:hypothetical protein NE237_005470 [Protea cynaroides]|uniref:Uncharacterized protein n=1 Tax=Protea cynaroides TaxID=273540 RepID=A0A9Q0KKV8_9MAGN|nr:hypothetical protein NE237_005470 [Protea cynaroides]